MNRSLSAILGLALVVLASSCDAGEPAPANPAKVSYYKDIRPIFLQHCQGCHQPAKAQGDYVMTGYDEVFKGGNSGKTPIVKGQPSASHIVQQITAQKDKPPAMPKVKALEGPPPGVGLKTVTEAVPTTDSKQYHGRIDHRFGDRNSLFGRYSWFDHKPFQKQVIFPGDMFGRKDDMLNKNIALSDTHTISPTLINEFRIGVVRQAFSFADANTGRLDIPLGVRG